MTECTIPYQELTLFDIDDDTEVTTGQVYAGEEAAAAVLSLSRCAMQFARVERVPRYDPESRENDAEHSFMLALVATELAKRYFPDLDNGLVTQYSMVHDLIELETSDVATFILDETDLAAKEAAEHAALGHVAAALPQHTGELLIRYEAQTDQEARFVRLVDKILPVAVDILGPGKQVMAEDYGIETVAQLDAAEAHLRERLRSRFAEPELAFLHFVRDILATRFSLTFTLELPA